MLEQCQPGGAAVLILLAYLNSIFGACLSGNNAASRVFFGMGRSHALPAALGKVGGKARMPTNAITLQAFLTLAVGFGMSLALGPANQLYLLATVITLGLSLVYIAGNIGVMSYYLRERRSELNWLLHVIFPVASSAAILAVCYKSVVPLPAWPVSLAPFITIGWLVIGLVVVAVLSRSGRAEWLRRAGDGRGAVTPQPMASGQTSAERPGAGLAGTAELARRTWSMARGGGRLT